MTNYYGCFYFVCVLLGRLKAGLRVVVSELVTCRVGIAHL